MKESFHLLAYSQKILLNALNLKISKMKLTLKTGLSVFKKQSPIHKDF